MSGTTLYFKPINHRDEKLSEIDWYGINQNAAPYGDVEVKIDAENNLAEIVFTEVLPLNQRENLKKSMSEYQYLEFKSYQDPRDKKKPQAGFF